MILPTEIAELARRRADDLSLYRDFMELIKFRIDLTSRLIAEPNSFALPGVTIAELCTLQHRMICEMIALACLGLHRELPNARTARISSFYQADAILNALEKLQPQFYPQPLRK